MSRNDEHGSDPSLRAARRRVLKRLAYLPPAVTALKMEAAMAQIGSPPPPPEVLVEPPPDKAGR